MNTKPFPHQVADAEHIERHGGRALVGSEMGTGKSLSALLYAHRHPELRPLVIVCPASLKWNWERECATHFSWRADVLETTSPKTAPIPTRPAVVVVNYDVLYAWVDKLKGLKPKLIIADEIHYAASSTARRSKALAELCRGVPHVIGLSGTPFVNRPIELWHPMEIIRPGHLGSYFAFGHRHCGPKRNPFSRGFDFSGASNLEELHAKLQAGGYLRRRRADVFAGLPGKQRSVVPLAIERPGEYRKAVEDYLGWVADTDPARLGKAIRSQQIAKLGDLKRLAARLKLPAVVRWTEDFLAGSEGKLILFGIHRESVTEALHARFPETSVLVTGATVGKKRQRAFDRFLRDPKCRVLVGNIDAAGVGWSAKGVGTVAFAECAWAPGKHAQAEDRIAGAGRGVPGVPPAIYYLVGRGTVEEQIAAMLQRKQRHASAVFDGDADENTLDIFSLLTQQLQREGKR